MNGASNSQSVYQNADGTDSRNQQQPQQYSGGAFSDSSKGSIDTSQQVPQLPETPLVRGGGSGNLSVDTTALKVFADNLDTIADALGNARTRVQQLQPIRAGDSELGFVEAGTLADKITGNSGGDGLQQNYMTSLTALRTALMDTAEGIRTLASKYSTIEEINQNAGNELSQLIQQAQSDLASLQSATGDSSAAPAAQPAGASQPAGTSQPAGGAQSSGATG